MLRMDGLDAVSIVSPVPQHHPMALAALTAGCAADAADASSEGTATDDVTQFVGDSSYTKLSGEACKVTEQDDESDVVVEECAGKGPYGLQIWSGDLRMRATVFTSESAFEPGSTW